VTGMSSQSRRGLRPKVSYFLALVDLSIILLADLSSLFVRGWIYLLAPIVLIAGMVVNSLLVSGPYKGNRVWSLLLTYPGVDELPWWAKYLIGLGWLFAVTSVLATLTYFATHGEVHGDQYFYAHGQSRPATEFEIRREYSWVLGGFSGFLVPFLIYPALLFFFERRIARAARSGSSGGQAFESD